MFVRFISSTPEQSYDDSVCPGDGVGAKHRARQAVHVALLGERAATGRVPYQCRRLWPSVSFLMQCHLFPFSLAHLSFIYFCKPLVLYIIQTLQENDYLKANLKTLVCGLF